MLIVTPTEGESGPPSGQPGWGYVPTMQKGVYHIEFWKSRGVREPVVLVERAAGLGRSLFRWCTGNSA